MLVRRMWNNIKVLNVIGKLFRKKPNSAQSTLITHRNWAKNKNHVF